MIVSVKHNLLIN